MAKGSKKPIEQCKRQYWRFMLYGDSAPTTLEEYVNSGRIKEFVEVDDDFDWECWKETFLGMERVFWYLDHLGVSSVLSPWHDLDVKDDGTGEIVKPHMHGIIDHGSPHPYELVLEELAPLGVKKLVKPKPIKEMERYLCHLDHPNKVKYDVLDIRTFCGWQLKYCGDRYDLDNSHSITEVIEELGIVYYADLAHELMNEHEELYESLKRDTAHWNNYCASRERMLRNAKRIPMRDEDGNILRDAEGNVITRLMSSYRSSRRRIGRYGD